MKPRSLRRGLAPAAVVAALSLGLTACGGANAGSGTAPQSGGGKQVSGAIRIDGSSTVGPLSTVAAELFMQQNPGAQVTVGTSGTGGGFEKFCAGETDISDASRPIEPAEAKACKQKGIEYAEIPVANDALTVVTNKANRWAKCLTVDQLKRVWEPKSKVNSWKQVDPGFPAEKLELFGPGTDSGTFEYFTEEITGEEGASRTDYSASEDDNVIVQGVAGSKGGLGYFGYTYFEENKDELNAVQIDGGNGCVAPSRATVLDGSYQPLSRPLYIYVSTEAMQQPQVKAFVDYYAENIDEIAPKAKFIELNDEQKAELAQTVGKLTG
ncbi:MAG: PstS family phosphate ABC transporter substrate-binding protein [Carbonactinosporaceae bacterium]